jgi:hypothetical protein
MRHAAEELRVSPTVIHNLIKKELLPLPQIVIVKHIPWISDAMSIAFRRVAAANRGKR